MAISIQKNLFRKVTFVFKIPMSIFRMVASAFSPPTSVFKTATSSFKPPTSVSRWDKRTPMDWNPSVSFSSRRFTWSSLMREESVIFGAESINHFYFYRCFVRRIAVCGKGNF